VSSRNQSELAELVGRTFADELLRAAADLDVVEGEVEALRRAQAALEASRLGRLARTVDEARTSVRGALRAPRRVLTSARPLAPEGVRSPSTLKPTRGELRLVPPSVPGAATQVDETSLPTGRWRGKGGTALLSRRKGGGLLVAHTGRPGRTQTVALKGRVPVASVSADGHTAWLLFDAAAQPSGVLGVEVRWTDPAGEVIATAECYEPGVTCRLAIPPQAASLQLALLLQGDGIAFLDTIRLSSADGTAAAPADPDAVAAAPSGPVPVRVSLIVPMFNVAGYLPELLDSFEAQLAGPYELEIVFVDDGSTDETATLVADWIARLPTDRGGPTAQLVRQPNAGTSAAKNAGLQAATGDYVSFVDGDDLLEDSYLRDVSEFVLSLPQLPAMVDVPVARWDEGTPRETAVTMLAHKYASGSRVVHLTEEPDVIKTHTASAFFLREQLLATKLTYPTGIHSSEDMLFCASFLASLPDPRLAVVDGGRYLYRRRSQGTQLSSAVWTNPAWIVTKMRAGYLPLIEGAVGDGELPSWLSSFLLYDYRWLVERLGGPQAAEWPLETRREILDLVRAGLRHISHDDIEAYDSAPMPPVVRRKLHLLKDRDWAPVEPD